MVNPPTPATSDMSLSLVLSQLMESLIGIWNINRLLQSENSNEPSGKCHGTATFTSRPPTPYIDEDGKLCLASIELLYHEQGEFEMVLPASGAPPGSTFPFSRKYIWRLGQGEEASNLSIWFVKPGTESLDYLFHSVGISVDASVTENASFEIHGMGGHLCVEDYYSSTYDFHIATDPASHESLAKIVVTSLTIEHEVRGPKKDQTITTTFVRL